MSEPIANREPRTADRPAAPPIRSWLRVPAADLLLADAVSTDAADALLLDLADVAPPDERDHVRAAAARVVRWCADQPNGPALFARVSHPDSGLTPDDVAVVVRRGLQGLWLPRVESPEDVWRAHPWVAAAEERHGIRVGALPFVCEIGSAAGVWRAVEIARASSRVLALAFDARAFLRDVGASAESDQGLETLYARSHLVLASRIAGIRPPVDGAHPRPGDPDGLERTSRQARALGFFGRVASEPGQVEVINRVHGRR